MAGFVSDSPHISLSSLFYLIRVLCFYFSPGKLLFLLLKYSQSFVMTLWPHHPFHFSTFNVCAYYNTGMPVTAKSDVIAIGVFPKY